MIRSSKALMSTRHYDAETDLNRAGLLWDGRSYQGLRLHTSSSVLVEL